MGKIADRDFCMSSWLMFRTVVDNNRCFVDGIKDFHVLPPEKRQSVTNSQELEGRNDEGNGKWPHGIGVERGYRFCYIGEDDATWECGVYIQVRGARS